MNTTPRILLPFLFSLSLGLATGCMVRIGGTDPHARQEVPKPAPPIVVVPENTEDSAVMAEIDAAGRLGFDSSRVEALRAVAARPSLGPATQVHLVNTALRTLEFDSSKVQVLMALIQNPALSASGKEAIYRQLDRLEFESSRTQVMQALRPAH